MRPLLTDKWSQSGRLLNMINAVERGWRKEKTVLTNQDTSWDVLYSVTWCYISWDVLTNQDTNLTMCHTERRSRNTLIIIIIMFLLWLAMFQYTSVMWKTLKPQRRQKKTKTMQLTFIWDKSVPKVASTLMTPQLSNNLHHWCSYTRLQLACLTAHTQCAWPHWVLWCWAPKASSCFQTKAKYVLLMVTLTWYIFLAALFLQVYSNTSKNRHTYPSCICLHKTLSWLAETL